MAESENIPSCPDCSLTFCDFVKKFHKDNTATISFFRAHNILPPTVTCPKCSSTCIFRPDKHIWRCHKEWRDKKHKNRIKRCGFSISDHHGTFLEKSHIQPWQVLMFCVFWLKKTYKQREAEENIEIAPKTCVDWRSHCSEVTLDWFNHQQPIGGDNIVVEIDETLMVKRRQNTGSIVKEIWLFGGIERVSKKRFIVPLQDKDDKAVPRNREALFPIIEKYIRPGSIIVSDCWKAYDTPHAHNYEHWKINRSLNFIDSNDREVHTQNIKRLWRDIKEYIKRPGIRSKYLAQYISRYLFIKDTPKLRLHYFMQAAARVYPHSTK